MLGWQEALEQVVFAPFSSSSHGLTGFLSSFYFSLLSLLCIFLFVILPCRLPIFELEEKLKEQEFRKKYVYYQYLKMGIFAILFIVGVIGYLIVVKKVC